MRVFQFLVGNFEKLIANFCLASLVALLGAQVFSRYILQIGLSWSEELSRFSFIWFVYISGSLAAQKGRHIRVKIGVELLPTSWRKYVEMGADFLWLFFNGVVAFSGVLLLKIMLSHPLFSASLYISMAYIYSIIPLAHLLMMARIIEGYWLKYRGGQRNSEEMKSILPPEA
jgi:C4-dicarboxylate transporter, DctQ subunit